MVSEIKKEMAKELANRVDKELADKGFEVTVDVKEVTKTNGVKKVGLTISQENDEISPVIYIDQSIKDIEENKVTVDNVVKSIVDMYEEVAKTKDDNPYGIVGLIENKETILDNVLPFIMNRDKNNELFNQVPHRRYLDFIVVYKIYSNVDGETATITITHDLADQMEMSESELYDAAIRNQKKKKPVIQSLGSLLGGMLGDIDDDTDPGLVLLSNEDYMYGSSLILIPSIIEDIAKGIESDVYILPSSIHELLLLPAPLMDDESEILDIVRDINKNVVQPDIFLSDNIYKFSLETNDIELVG